MNPGPGRESPSIPSGRNHPHGSSHDRKPSTGPQPSPLPTVPKTPSIPVSDPDRLVSYEVWTKARREVGAFYFSYSHKGAVEAYHAAERVVNKCFSELDEHNTQWLKSKGTLSSEVEKSEFLSLKYKMAKKLKDVKQKQMNTFVDEESW